MGNTLKAFSDLLTQFILIGLLGLFCFPKEAYSKNPLLGMQNSVPVNGNFLGPQAVLFTPLTAAGVLNAATLAGPESFTALELAYSPGRGTTPQNFYTGIASAHKVFGVGLGYFGSLGSLKSTNGGFFGMGFRNDLSRYGISYRTIDFSSGGMGDVDLSYIYFDPREGIAYGGVLRSVNNSRQVDFGIGYSIDKTFNMELNVNTPPAKQFSEGNFVIRVASNFTVSSQIGSHVELNFNTKSSSVGPLIGLTYSISPFATTLIQYASPNVWSLGFALVF